MAAAEGKLNISELDFTKIKDNLTGFLTSQVEFVGYNFKGSSLDVLLDVLSYNTLFMGLVGKEKTRRSSFLG